MIRLRIPDAEWKSLEQERFQHPNPRVQRKIDAVYLAGRGLPHHGGGAAPARFGGDGPVLPQGLSNGGLECSSNLIPIRSRGL
jgi:hypothetical protein